MHCVYYNEKAPNGFEEHFDYGKGVPYYLRIKQFDAENIVPLHYAKTMEVLVCDNLKGQVIIDNKHYCLGGQQVFVIPPYTVHANTIEICDGTQYVFKVNFSALEQYVNIPRILADSGRPLEQLSYVCPEYETVKGLIDELIRNDGDLSACLPVVLELFSVFSRHLSPGRNAERDNSRLNADSLQELINWTQQNYMKKVSLDEVARRMGYSKFYFCSRFKALTGITYLSYLNSVRVSNACLLLLDGQPVQKVCADCGFENTSYFIQVFKRIRHMTPHQYAAQHRSAQPQKTALPEKEKIIYKNGE